MTLCAQVKRYNQQLVELSFYFACFPIACTEPKEIVGACDPLTCKRRVIYVRKQPEQCKCKEERKTYFEPCCKFSHFVHWNRFGWKCCYILFTLGVLKHPPTYIEAPGRPTRYSFVDVNAPFTIHKSWVKSHSMSLTFEMFVVAYIACLCF